MSSFTVSPVALENSPIRSSAVLMSMEWTNPPSKWTMSKRRKSLLIKTGFLGVKRGKQDSIHSREKKCLTEKTCVFVVIVAVRRKHPKNTTLSAFKLVSFLSWDFAMTFVCIFSFVFFFFHLICPVLFQTLELQSKQCSFCLLGFSFKEWSWFFTQDKKPLPDWVGKDSGKGYVWQL